MHPACKQLVRHGKGKCRVHMDDGRLAPQPEPIVTYLTAHTHPALNTFHLSSLKAQRGSLISVTSPFGSRQTSLLYNGPAQTLRTLCISFLPQKKLCLWGEWSKNCKAPWLLSGDICHDYVCSGHKICVLLFNCCNLLFKARETVGHNELKTRNLRNLFDITWSKL